MTKEGLKMEDINCYDIALEVIEEAGKRFGSLYKINEDNLQIFEDYCEHIDFLLHDLDANSVEVEVDENTTEIMITIYCDSMMITTKENSFYTLIQKAVRYGFSTDDGDLAVHMVFPSLWDRV